MRPPSLRPSNADSCNSYISRFDQDCTPGFPRDGDGIVIQVGCLIFPAGIQSQMSVPDIRDRTLPDQAHSFERQYGRCTQGDISFDLPALRSLSQAG